MRFTRKFKAPFYLLNFPLYIKPYSQRCACRVENILFFSVFYCHGQRNVRPLLRCTFLSSSWNIYLSRAKCDFSSANCPIWQIYVISESSLQILTLHLETILTRAFFLKGKWFYALLVCLEKPLLPETTSLLRTLARLCATLRASLVCTYDLLKFKGTMLNANQRTYHDWLAQNQI